MMVGLDADILVAFVGFALGVCALVLFITRNED